MANIGYNGVNGINEKKLSEDMEAGVKLLAQKIPVDMYWKFKEAAAKRQETARESLINAVLLYIAAGEE